MQSVSSVMPREQTESARWKTAVRITNLKILFDAVHSLCWEQKHRLVDLSWNVLKPTLLEATSDSGQILFDGQNVPYDYYISNHLKSIEDHFQNHVSLRYEQTSRRYTGLFLQNFLQDVRGGGMRSDKTVLECLPKVRFIKSDMLEAFVQSKFKNLLEASGTTLIAAFQAKKKIHNNYLKASGRTLCGALKAGQKHQNKKNFSTSNSRSTIQKSSLNKKNQKISKQDKLAASLWVYVV